MENPCLTFVSSTLLAGDRSQAYVIAHEIAHSWTGNLVTNKNSEHFWLNEGFTVFTEQKIQGRMFGEPHRHLSAILITRGLENTIKDMGENGPFTSLVTNLTGINPDEAFSIVPYAKGSIFLWYLEETVGGPGEYLLAFICVWNFCLMVGQIVFPNFKSTKKKLHSLKPSLSAH